MKRKDCPFLIGKKFDIILGYDLDLPSVFNIFEDKIQFLLCFENQFQKLQYLDEPLKKEIIDRLLQIKRLHIRISFDTERGPMHYPYNIECMKNIEYLCAEQSQLKIISIDCVRFPKL